MERWCYTVDAEEKAWQTVRYCIVVNGTYAVTQLRSVTCYMGSHSVTCHPTQVNTPRLNPARQAGTRFTYPGGMKGWVDLGNSLHTEMVYPPADKVKRPAAERETWRKTTHKHSDTEDGSQMNERLNSNSAVQQRCNLHQLQWRPSVAQSRL